MFSEFCATMALWFSAIAYAVAESVEQTFEELFE